MRIKLEDSFSIRFERQLRFIADDSPARAKQFKAQVVTELKSLTHSPLRCRKSIYFEDENIRDMIYKGYTITYRITAEEIQVIGFTKYQNNPTD